MEHNFSLHNKVFHVEEMYLQRTANFNARFPKHLLQAQFSKLL